MRLSQAREDRPMLGLGMMCVTMALFTSVDSSAKWLILSGFPIMQVVLVRYAGHFTAALVFFMLREGPDAFRSNRPWMQFLRSVALLASTGFNFAALKYLPITVTTAIFFASPMVITLLSVLFLRERIGGRRIVAILVGFIGVLIVVQPWGAGFHPAMWFSVCALCCASGYFVLTRLLAGVEANSTSQLWASGLATLSFLPFGLAHWTWPESTTAWVVMCCIGLFAVVGHVIAVAAHRLADASVLAPVIYVQVIYATFSGYMLFGNLPTWATAVGTFVIVTSGVYIWRREQQLMLQRQAAVVP
jgi:drug/metabolite transporter (DMT)-like permease